MTEKFGLYVEADKSEQLYTTEHRAIQLTYTGSSLMVDSPIHEHYSFNKSSDRLAHSILSSPLAIRASDIAQLSKVPEHATIPNTGSFSRLGHVAELMHITTLLAREKNISQENLDGLIVYQGLDLMHGPISHGSDNIHGGDGSETFHEVRGKEALKTNGIVEVFTEEDITGLLANRFPSWAEDKLPNLCTDRWQYGVEEARLWFSGNGGNEKLSELHERIIEIGNLESVEITKDNELAFVNIELARIYAKSYLLLATEHWNDPINRLQIFILMHAIKRAIVMRQYSFMDELDHGKTKHPESYSYATDHDVLNALRKKKPIDDFMFQVNTLLSSVGKEERERFIYYKRDHLASFILDNYATEYPSSFINDQVDNGPAHSQVVVEPVPRRSRYKSSSTPRSVGKGDELELYLPPLKNRHVDPKVICKNGTTKKLSELDTKFQTLLEQQQQVQQLSLRVKLILTPGYRAEFKRAIKENDAKMAKLCATKSKLSNDRIRTEIRHAADRALAVSVERGFIIDKR